MLKNITKYAPYLERQYEVPPQIPFVPRLLHCARGNAPREDLCQLHAAIAREYLILQCSTIYMCFFFLIFLKILFGNKKSTSVFGYSNRFSYVQCIVRSRVFVMQNLARCNKME